MTSPSAILQAVLPYFTIPDGHIHIPIVNWSLPIHPFGLLVATGIIVGHRLAMSRAKVLGLDEEKFERLVFWTVLTGIVLSHMLDTIFYHSELLTRPTNVPILGEVPGWFELLMIHHGLSSFGGFFGAGIGFFVYSRRHKVDVWRSADAIAYGLPVGWQFGRTGCSVVHDHPGHPSNSFIAMHFDARPQLHLLAGNYLDLGIIEWCLNPFIIAAAFFVASRTKKPGAVIATITLLYPIIRFPLDYLRMPDENGGDNRIFGFTPGQYACVLCFGIGLYILRRTWNLPAEEPKKPAVPKSTKTAKPAKKAAAQ